MTGWVCTAAITIKVLNPSRSKGFAAAPAVEIWRAIVAKAAEELVRRDRRFADSPLEGTGFELPVPRDSVRAEPISSQAASMLRYMTIRRTRGIDVVLRESRSRRRGSASRLGDARMRGC